MKSQKYALALPTLGLPCKTTHMPFAEAPDSWTMAFDGWSNLHFCPSANKFCCIPEVLDISPITVPLLHIATGAHVRLWPGLVGLNCRRLTLSRRVGGAGRNANSCLTRHTRGKVAIQRWMTCLEFEFRTATKDIADGMKGGGGRIRLAEHLRCSYHFIHVCAIVCVRVIPNDYC